MSSSAQEAVRIDIALRRPLGELPATVDVEDALKRLRSLPLLDEADAIVIRDLIGKFGLLHDAAQHAEATDS